LWDVASGRLRQTLAGHTDGINRVAWSPDGRTLASGSRDTTIRLWDVEEGSARAVLQGHRAEVYGLAFTPDSRSLLSCSDDGTLRLWEVASGQCGRVLQGYTAALFDLDWSPDGTQLASAGADTVVSLWPVAGSAGGGCGRTLPAVGRSCIHDLAPSRGLQPGWHAPGRRGRRWPRICVGRRRWHAAAAAGGPSRGHHERGLQPRWLQSGHDLQQQGRWRAGGVGRPERGTRARLCGAS